MKDLVEEYKKDPAMSSTTSVNEDILTKVLGPEKNSYLRAFGRGVTRSKLQIVSERDDHLIKIEGQCKNLNEKMQHMEQLIVSLMKNQVSILMLKLYFHVAELQ